MVERGERPLARSKRCARWNRSWIHALRRAACCFLLAGPGFFRPCCPVGGSQDTPASPWMPSSGSQRTSCRQQGELFLHLGGGGYDLMPSLMPSLTLLLSLLVTGTLTKFTLVLYGTSVDPPNTSNEFESSGCKTLATGQACVGKCWLLRNRFGGDSL